MQSDVGGFLLIEGGLFFLVFLIVIIRTGMKNALLVLPMMVMVAIPATATIVPPTKASIGILYLAAIVIVGLITNIMIFRKNSRKIESNGGNDRNSELH